MKASLHPVLRFFMGPKHIPVLATAAIFMLLFGVGAALYPNLLSLRAEVNLFRNNANLGVIAIGMTFVILSGGIDLSVGSVMGFTTIFIAAMITEQGIHPLLVWIMALGLGAAFGSVMGLLIEVYRLPPFLVTLSGMFFARGMAFVVQMLSLGIQHPLYDRVTDFGIPLNDRGVAITVPMLIFLSVFIAAIVLAHYTRFGRNVYALGSSEPSAVLMGLPVAATKVKVYALSGSCAALAGIISTLDMHSGDPARGNGLELSAIASVVIGGTLLTGGVGYVAGTLLGVLIYGTIRMMIDFDGKLNSSYQPIAIGVLLLLFILLQKLIARSAVGGRTGREAQ